MAKVETIKGVHYLFDHPNKSFQQTAKELKILGIKNYYFMLRINDPAVADIDPFKKNITANEILRLMNEYRNNLWFFAGTAVRLRTAGGVVPFALHRGLAAALWCFERSQDFCLTEPRQTWKTSGLIGTGIQWMFQLSQNSNIHFFGKDNTNTKGNLATLRDDITLLPKWLQFESIETNDGRILRSKRATQGMNNVVNHNNLYIYPKASSLDHAQMLGRGSSGNIIYFDEIEHTPFFGEILSNTAPAFKVAGDTAKENGQVACRCMTSTAANLDTAIGRDVMPIIESMIPWSESLYDKTDEEIQLYKDAYQAKYDDGEGQKHQRQMIDVFHLEYQYYQVRKTYDWVREQFRLSGDKNAVIREILLKRQRGSLDNPIDLNVINYLISNMKKSDKDIIVNNKYRFRIYDHGISHSGYRVKLLDDKIPYLIGIDPAGGGGGDNFAITIVNPYNRRIAAELKYNYISGPEACRMLNELVLNYIPKAVLIPERNSIGIYLIQMLLESEIRGNLYWSESTRQLEEMTEEIEENMKPVFNKYKKYGIYTNKTNRKAMFDILFRHLNLKKDLINTEYLVDDICNLVKKGDKIEAGKGAHDDNLMSYLMAMYIYYTGDNLATFGITKRVDPMLDMVEEESEESIAKREIVEKILYKDKSELSYDDIVMIDGAIMENQIKTLCGKFSNPTSSIVIHDARYNNIGNSLKNPYDDTVDLGMWIFDQANGL